MSQRGVLTTAMAVGASGLFFCYLPAFAAEHGGAALEDTAAQEHGGATVPQAHEHGGTTQEHGGQAVQTEPTVEQIRQAIADHVQGIVTKDGAFTIKDDVTGTTRTLELVRVHERVGKTGKLYYSCTDMRDTTTGELLDLDFDVDAAAGQLQVVDTRIHKVNDKARYTYDEHDNRIPATAESSQPATEREQTE